MLAHFATGNYKAFNLLVRNYSAAAVRYRSIAARPARCQVAAHSAGLAAEYN
jgi:hypothetical protein